MHEILIDRRKVVAMDHRVHQVFAHGNERRSAARREIEPSEQLLPARLGRKMQFGCRILIGPPRPRIDCRIDTFAIDAEMDCERLEEGDARAGCQLVVAGEDFARERDSQSLAAPGQKLLAQVDEALRACRSATASVARAVDQRAAALRDALEQFAEKRGVHTVPMARAAPRRPRDPAGLTFRNVEPLTAGLRRLPSRLSGFQRFRLAAGLAIRYSLTGKGTRTLAKTA